MNPSLLLTTDCYEHNYKDLKPIKMLNSPENTTFEV